MVLAQEKGKPQAPQGFQLRACMAVALEKVYFVLAQVTESARNSLQPLSLVEKSSSHHTAQETMLPRSSRVFREG